MKKFLSLVSFVVLLCACQHTPSFTVSGTMIGAEGETIYLEHTALMKTTVVDSAVVDKKGGYSLKADAPEYPDLYRLRVADKRVVLAVDSTEHIVVDGQAGQREYTISGSEETQQIYLLRQSLRDNTTDAHKAYARSIILSNPKSIVAYYALFQTKAGSPVFSFAVKEDRACFQAVATAYSTWMPDYERSKILYSQVLEAINSERRAINTAAMQQFIDDTESAFLDATLADQNGQMQSILQYKGKVIVLSFSSLQMEKSKGYIFEMRDIYNSYHARGLEIYEIYPDPNRLVWEEQVRELPWTTVRTDNGLLNSVYSTFNVQSIPTLFLYNRQGQIIGRFASFEALRAAIEKNL